MEATEVVALLISFVAVIIASLSYKLMRSLLPSIIYKWIPTDKKIYIDSIFL